MRAASGPRGTSVFAVLDSSRFWNAQRAGELSCATHRGCATHCTAPVLPAHPALRASLPRSSWAP